MNKNSTITVRLDPQVKQNPEAVLKTLYLTTSQAMNLFFTQVSLNKGIPLMYISPIRPLPKPFKRGLLGAA